MIVSRIVLVDQPHSHPAMAGEASAIMPVGTASHRRRADCQASIMANGTKGHSVVSEIPALMPMPSAPSPCPEMKADIASCRPTDVTAKARLKHAVKNTLRGQPSTKL